MSAITIELGRYCLVQTNWTTHLRILTDRLRELGHDPVLPKGRHGREGAAQLTPQHRFQ
jgi:hypothetical protein